MTPQRYSRLDIDRSKYTAAADTSDEFASCESSVSRARHQMSQTGEFMMIGPSLIDQIQMVSGMMSSFAASLFGLSSPSCLWPALPSCLSLARNSRPGSILQVCMQAPFVDTDMHDQQLCPMVVRFHPRGWILIRCSRLTTILSNPLATHQVQSTPKLPDVS